MKLSAMIVGLFLATGPAHSQQLDVWFEIADDNQAAGCSGASVMGLDPNGDGFLAVRSGPGTDYRKVDELRNGDTVRTCAREGNWWGVYYGQPRRVGWVHGNWLGNWAG